MKIIIRWITPIFLLVTGIYFQISADYKELLVLPRMGAVIVIFGILIESRYVLRIVGDDVYTGAETLTIGKAPTPKTLKEFIRQFINHIGLVWVILGTLVWAFGDLL